MAEQTSDQQQTTIQTPGQYAPGGEKIWFDWLDSMFGNPHASEAEFNAIKANPDSDPDYAWLADYETYEDYLKTPETPGLLGLQQQQNQFETDQWNQLNKNIIQHAYDQFGQGIDYIAGSGNRYAEGMQPTIQGVEDAQDRAAKNPFNLKIAGGNFDLLQQGGINMAKDRYAMDEKVQDQILNFNSNVLPNLNSQRLIGEVTPGQANYDFAASHNPAGVEARYIQDTLTPIAQNQQALRYGLPLVNTSASTTGSNTLGTLGTLGQVVNALGGLGISGGDLIKGATWAGSGLEDAYDWLKNLDLGFDFDWGGGGGGGGITYT